MWITPRRRNQIRHRAAELTSLVGFNGQLSDILAATERLADVSIDMKEGDLPAGCLGVVKRVEDAVLITISNKCATRYFTVVHEVGHILLDHNHIDSMLIDYESSTSLLANSFLNTDEQNILMEVEEREAEIFSNDFFKFLPSAGLSHVSRQWIVSVS